MAELTSAQLAARKQCANTPEGRAQRVLAAYARYGRTEAVAPRKLISVSPSTAARLMQYKGNRRAFADEAICSALDLAEASAKANTAAAAESVRNRK